MMESALIAVHPFPAYDWEMTEKKLLATLQEFQGDRILLHQSSSKPDFNRNPYGNSELYDDVIFDQAMGPEGSGRLQEDDAEIMSDNYDKILIGGGEVGACHFETYASLAREIKGERLEEDAAYTTYIDDPYISEMTEEVETEINFVPEITYGTDGYGNPFTLEKVATEARNWGRIGLNHYDWDFIGLEPMVSENTDDIETLERYLKNGNNRDSIEPALRDWKYYKEREETLTGSLINRINDSDVIPVNKYR